MKRVLLITAAAFVLAGCSSGGLAKLQANLNNFTTGVASVNAAIASVSQSLGQNCAQLQATTAALANLTSDSRSAGPSFAAANAAIVAYCQDLPNNIPTAVQATADAVKAAKSAYNAAKAGN